MSRTQSVAFEPARMRSRSSTAAARMAGVTAGSAAGAGQAIADTTRTRTRRFNDFKGSLRAAESYQPRTRLPLTADRSLLTASTSRLLN